MPAAGGVGWRDSRVTPARGCAQGRTLPPPSHPLRRSPPMPAAWRLSPELAGTARGPLHRP